MVRTVFMGTPEFAVPALNALLRDGYNVVGVLTRQDQPAGRGQQVEGVVQHVEDVLASELADCCAQLVAVNLDRFS